MKNLLMTAFVGLCALVSQATANITGYWTTIDDETKEAKSVVQIYEYQGKYYGRVVELLDQIRDDERKNKPQDLQEQRPCGHINIPFCSSAM